MDIITIINLLILAVLIVLTAFFVASEFAVVKIRMSRIDQLIAEGNKKAHLAKKVASDLDYYLSACQLGITVTALGLGAIGKPAVERLMYPVFDLLNVSAATASIASYAIAFALVTFLHVVIGEMAPKTLAIQFSEKLTLMLAPYLYWFGKIMNPFIWALNGTSRVLLRSFGVKPAGHEDIYSESELKIIMTQSFQGGEINQTKLDYMENVFSFDERVTRDIMVPRTALVTLDLNMTEQQIIATLDENYYTRYPVTQAGDKDLILGVVNVKKMLPHIVAGREHQLQQFVRTLPSVQEATPIQDAMIRMQKERVHMALVIDEYGGTSGVITMEDVLEELVGEIRDEFDADEVADIQPIDDTTYLINGRTLLDELEKQFGMTFENDEEIDTIGGWIQHYKGTDVQVGEVLEQDDYVWTVTEKDHLQIKQVRLYRA
ncbi:CBS domain containing-hemolysin-like protein [Paenibacillus sp. SORGH_AS306]|uniref:Hemolysin family protein n=1 Tax=Paenibacillus kyungheensis TaxID=1452732 RepID=A0AAX3LZ57_9BACL|nr:MULTISPECIES: hemolysin family protein [Paenibacillus]MDQ1235159.1 CBS domain containing-hemolysin-like protein [Paenibacillus sp. SORGH_AS_0306]MDR6112206.1 CBS domain containing-hemolysin-like protein [Paenibacillus sp. SORGH_AS_0338]WCT54719.1 hemolysin family protein [Paenibacillus kyungheensis]WDF52135.1 hemolysin family protein [Paenibacillus sp. KACC 21273]